MDRLDTWLNAQRGWHGFLVAWLVALPGGVALSTLWVAASQLFGPTALSASAVLARLELGVVASVPLAVLNFALVSIYRRRPAKRGKNPMPRYLWRGIASIHALVAAGAYEIWVGAQPVQRHRQHHSFLIFFGLLALASLYVAAIALMIWNLQYSRRLQQRTAEVAANDLRSLLGQTLGHDIPRCR
jgi:hypothetical protein